MNKLTKSELIERIRKIIDDPKRIIAQPYIDGERVIHIIQDTEIIPDSELEPKPEPVDQELEEAKKLVGSKDILLDSMKYLLIATLKHRKAV